MRRIKLKEYFRVFLMVAILSVSLGGSAEGNTDRRVQGAWEKYQTYSLASNYLSNIGFDPKANCAISLMKSVSFNVSAQDIEEVNKVLKTRSMIFAEVVEEGVGNLIESKLFSKQSDQKLRESVYQSFLKSESFLNTTISALKQISEYKQADNSELYKRIYIGSRCSTIIGFSYTE